MESTTGHLEEMDQIQEGLYPWTIEAQESELDQIMVIVGRTQQKFRHFELQLAFFDLDYKLGDFWADDNICSSQPSHDCKHVLGKFVKRRHFFEQSMSFKLNIDFFDQPTNYQSSSISLRQRSIKVI
jgi:hypothetical protein